MRSLLVSHGHKSLGQEKDVVKSAIADSLLTPNNLNIKRKH